MFIKVKVFPDSKKEEIIKKSKDSFEIRVKQKPLRGEANKRAMEALTHFLKITESDIRLIKGHKQRNKIFEIKDGL